MSNDQQTKIKNGKIGEVLVELELLKRDWHVERLDGAAKAVNGDLIAIKGKERVVIQVKSALSWKRPSFGHAGPYLIEKKPIFNSGNAVIFADALVTVCGPSNLPIFHVFRIKDAERLARKKARYWYKKPKRDGSQRSPNFPISVSLDDEAIKSHADAWQLLNGI